MIKGQPFTGWIKISKMKLNWRELLYFFALSTVMLSVICTFIDEKSAKVAFYWAFYFSIPGIIVSWRQINRSHIWLVGALVLLGASKVIWFYWHYLGQPELNPFNDYLNAGKRLLIAAVIGYYLFKEYAHFPLLSQRIVEWGLFIAFISATGYGFYQFLSGSQRVEFSLDRATVSAYGYAMLSAITIFIVAAKKSKKHQILWCLALFIISWFIIIQTGTRNMMAAFPVVIFFIGLLQFKYLGWRAAVGSFIAILLLGAACYQPMIKPRLDKTITEIDRYSQDQGNKMGSLTSRFAMWNIGIACFRAYPLGMNMEQRETWFKRYVKEHHRDASALPYVSVHLHNELIDSATLQGILGALTILLFYMIILINALRRKNALLLSVIAIVIISGLTDVVFISRELTVCTSLLLILSVIWKDLITIQQKR
ncbi:O-antigen ligase family protein [Mixta intestinalis]|uniref:O-antigen ligase n=1 Tax=Mixta intestinalis TaxID=1615494 RepID=A0A6P1Q232_9GAMM|nr:O-antigen ligase family protein [Mixta intestinalis]QHM73046.1 O-antigen ligase [Mixta intestinalis]